MTDPVKEQLSAYLDGELAKVELDLMLKQVRREPRLQSVVGRYALVAEVLRTGTFPIPSAGFAARISQAIADDAGGSGSAAPLATRPIAPRWLRTAGGAAIAVGVATLAVMVLQPQLPETVPELVATTQPGATDSYTVPSATTPAPPLVPAADLAKYVMAHSEYALPLGRRTMMLSSVLSDDESEQSETVNISPPSDLPFGSSERQP